MAHSTEVKILPYPDAIWREWLAKGRKRDQVTAYRMTLCLWLTPVLLVLVWFLSRS